MADLRLGVLGELEAVRDGRRLPVPPGRRRAVLARLLVAAGRPVPADALVDAAWGQALPRDPPAALHTVVSRLRTLLGEGAVEAGPGGYRLRLRPDAVDHEEFEALLIRAAAAEPAAARVLLGQALGLWRGPAYAEYADASFAQAEAARLEGLRADARESLAAACLEAGDPGAAVAELESFLAEEPYRERAVELLVTALYRAGRQADALDRLRQHRARLADELGLDPSPALVDLEARILGHELPMVSAAPASSPRERPEPADRAAPPAWLESATAFVGREDDLADLVEAAVADRVSVVTGPAGVGKTRLAAEALPSLRARLRLPVAVTELAPVTHGGVAAAVADSLGLRPRTDKVTDEVVEHLEVSPHLLVLDNCEHLLDEVGHLVVTVTQRCRDVRVLATSRRRLGLGSERVLPLAPLPVPDAGGGPGGRPSTAAVRLVADRVRRLQPAFAVTEDNAADVAELCRRFDGLPLALELAGSRIATLGVAEMLTRVPADLVHEDRTGLQAAMDWSYRLLTEEQQELLAALSVMTTDFTVDAVRGLTAYLPSWGADPVAALAELVESSLVSRQVEGARARYRLLAVVRAFAGDRLAGAGRLEQTRLAHASWARDVASTIAAEWARVDGAELARRLTDAAPDITAAVRWALGSGHLRLASELTEAVVRCLHWTPGAELKELIVEVADRGLVNPGPEVAGGVAAGAFTLAERGELERATQLAEVAVEMSDGADVPLAYLAAGVAAMYTGDHDSAARWFRRQAEVPVFGWEAYSSLALLATYGDDLETAEQHAQVALAAGPSVSDASYAFARYAAGEVRARTDPAGGAALLAEAAAEADRVGAEQVGRVARIALLALLVRGGDHDEAVELGRRLLADLRLRGAWVQVWTTLRLLAELLAVIGRASDAAFLLGAVDAADSAPPPVGLDVPRYAELEAHLVDQVGVEVVDQVRRLAAATPRVQVLRRAEHLLARLADGRVG